MDREQLEQYTKDGLSLAGISAKCGKGKTAVRHWLKKFGLSTRQARIELGTIFVGKVCKRCDVHKEPIDFYRRRDGTNLSPYCKICTGNQTLERQRKFKLQCAEYKGGKCVQCGYDKCVAAFDFHHVDPNEKDFSIGNLKLYRFDDRIKQELDKCILLCSNCHRETHFLQEP
jgi:hypothetical protein